MLILNEVNFWTKNIMRDKWGHFQMMKMSINHKDISILNVCVYNNKSLKVCETKLINRTAMRKEQIHDYNWR